MAGVSSFPDSSETSYYQHQQCRVRAIDLASEILERLEFRNAEHRQLPFPLHAVSDRVEEFCGCLALLGLRDAANDIGAKYKKLINRRLTGSLDTDNDRKAYDYWLTAGVGHTHVLCELIRSVKQSLAAQLQPAEQVSSSGDDPHTPKKYHLSWREILDALELPNNDENKGRVRGLIELHGGPIILPQKGGQPKVERTKLIEWWNGLENRFNESEQRIRDRDATIAETHNYGRDGTVAPEIRGSVRHRRRTSAKIEKGRKTS